VTFEDDKKGKVFGTSIIKANDFFTLNNVTLVDRLRYNLLSISQLVDAELEVFFTNQILKSLILLALKIFFKLIFLLLSLP
jgi:hypothetical protein